MYPSRSELEQYKAAGYSLCPVASELLSDMITPIMLLAALKRISSHCYILESVEGSSSAEPEFWGRYTFLGYDPSLDIVAKDGTVLLKDAEGKVLEQHQGVHPDALIRRVLAERRSPAVAGLPPFTGGLVGYFGYDYIKYNEPKLKLDASDNDGFQDLDLMLFDRVFAFDNLLQKLFLIVNVDLKDPDASCARAEKELSKMKDIVFGAGGEGLMKTECSVKNMKPLFEEAEFCAMVEKAKEYIYEGDIFQVVLSNRLEADFEGDLFPVYRMLRTVNPSPYMFYFSGDEIEAAGASPETLVKLENGVLHTFPLAGTRPRGKNEEEDRALEKELLADEKERAEHNMLVDLGRNDLGKISEFGSVEVEKYMGIERFSHVMHIGSTVRGRLKKGLSAVDAVNAVLPAGTLSGAPKIRACEIINELEDNKRGIYGGAVGYLDLTGNLDTCIAIRLAYRKNGKIFVRSGAGIVADSVPESEYRECINKAKAVMISVEKANGLSDR